MIVNFGPRPSAGSLSIQIIFVKTETFRINFAWIRSKYTELSSLSSSLQLVVFCMSNTFDENLNQMLILSFGNQQISLYTQFYSICIEQTQTMHQYNRCRHKKLNGLIYKHINCFVLVLDTIISYNTCNVLYDIPSQYWSKPFHQAIPSQCNRKGWPRGSRYSSNQRHQRRTQNNFIP